MDIKKATEDAVQMKCHGQFSSGAAKQGPRRAISLCTLVSPAVLELAETGRKERK